MGVSTQYMGTMPKLSVCALRFTDGARRRIVAAKGECITLDQLVMRNPLGKDVVLLRGPEKCEKKKHFGAPPGTKNSKAKPHKAKDGLRRKKENGWGRRSRCGFKAK